MSIEKPEFRLDPVERRALKALSDPDMQDYFTGELMHLMWEVRDCRAILTGDAFVRVRQALDAIETTLNPPDEGDVTTHVAYHGEMVTVEEYERRTGEKYEDIL